MHTHIAKSLQTCCKAIQNAVQQHNIAAEQMSPSHPTLNWSKVSHYTFLEDFKLMHNTHHDICSKPWADPVSWSTMKQASCIKHTKEEIKNCNLKVWCLLTHVINENHDLWALDKKLEEEDDAITGAVNEYSTHRHMYGQHIYLISYIWYF